MTITRRLDYVFAVMVFLIFSALTGIIWSDLTKARDKDMQRVIDGEARHIAGRFNQQFQHEIQTLERLAIRWRLNNGIDEEAWRHDAVQIIEDFGNFQAVEWIDTRYRVRWIEPLKGNEEAVGFNVAFNDQRRQALDQARNQGSIDSTPVITLKQGGQGVVVYVPIGQGESFQGFIVGVFRIEDLISSLILEREAQHFSIVIAEAGRAVFGEPPAGLDSKLVGEANWSPFNTDWTLQLFPRQAWLELFQNGNRLNMLLIGLLNSALLAVAVFLALSNFQQKKRLAASNQAMLDEASQRQKVEADLSHVVSHDNLTGLPNRRFFIEDLQQAIQQARRSHTYLAVLIIDLDDFKKINDTLGHSSGDSLIKQVSERFYQVVGEYDAALARAGGDEFMLLLEDVDSVDEVISCASEIRRCFKAPFELDGKDFFITCSIGITVYPEGGTSTEDLIQNADVALYKAKDLGRDNYQFFTTGMQAEALRRLELDGLLRNAIALDQLSLVFQPKVSLSSGTIIGAEILLRWHHPEKGYISPGEFIPLAEETGMIKTLGRWVFEASCRQIAEWADTELASLKFAINLSSTQLDDPELASGFSRVVRKYGLDATSIEFELTEEVFIENIQHNQGTLAELKKLGFSLAIDDFGVGYSSLAYLRNFPISTVKIDRTFVSQLETNKDDQVIVNAVIAMAHNLGLDVVAEGIETAEQADYLKRQQCDQGQGYFYARPLPAEAFMALYQEQSGLLSQ